MFIQHYHLKKDGATFSDSELQCNLSRKSKI